MTSRSLIAMLAWIALVLPAQAQTLIGEFTGINFTGWDYNDPITTISSQSITQNQITLLTTDQGLVKALVSPMLNVAGFDSVMVQMRYNILPNYSGGIDYTRLAVTAQLLDLQGQEQSVMTLPVQPSIGEQTLTGTMPLPDGSEVLRLRLTAPRADGNNCGAVRRVRVYGISGVTGDVNGDGIVDIDDVNILINVVLRKDSADNYGTRAYVTGGDTVDIADVNAVINIVLRKG